MAARPLPHPHLFAIVYRHLGILRGHRAFITSSTPATICFAASHGYSSYVIVLVVRYVKFADWYLVATMPFPMFVRPG